MTEVLVFLTPKLLVAVLELRSCVFKQLKHTTQAFSTATLPLFISTQIKPWNVVKEDFFVTARGTFARSSIVGANDFTSRADGCVLRIFNFVGKRGGQIIMKMPLSE
jgi:hypothetical protein